MDGMFYDALETRDPAEREAALMAALPQVDRGGEGARAGLSRASREGAPGGRHRPPRARRSAADPQIRPDRDAAAATRPSAASRRCRSARWRGSSPRPARSTSRRRAGRISSAWRARCMPPASAPAISSTTRFSYHLTPAGAMVESAAQALGCPVIPAGTGQTEQQLRTIADLRPAAYVGTPSFLKILLDRAAERGRRYRLDHARRWSAPRRFRRRCGPSSATAASPRCNATAPPISA